MPLDPLTTETAEKVAVLISKVWSDPALAEKYAADPFKVLPDFGLQDLAEAPIIPQKPDSFNNVDLGAKAAFASASSLSTVSCPCTAFTASCANCATSAVVNPDINLLTKMADSPEARATARQMMSSWNVQVAITPPGK
ncbi:MAG: hypothetical protein QM820_08890 [Minicystis sp.]